MPAFIKAMVFEKIERGKLLIHGYTDGRMRLIIGKYRIIYNYTDEEGGKDGVIEILLIIKVDSRREIYKWSRRKRKSK